MVENPPPRERNFPSLDVWGGGKRGRKKKKPHVDALKAAEIGLGAKPGPGPSVGLPAAAQFSPLCRSQFQVQPWGQKAPRKTWGRKKRWTGQRGFGKRGQVSPSPPESRSIVSATTTMGLFSTWAKTKTWNSSRLSYTGSSELSTLGERRSSMSSLGYSTICFVTPGGGFTGSHVEVGGQH